MTGERDSAAPLRPRDPRKLGRYTLVGRLGEGGMGTVYLARTPEDVLVAVKMVRADLAPDDEFRRRFRSEVNRVRQVPPFCTAEVLDADPDHEQPYLVVEYVDAPTLADVVQDRGPLTAANLHSVAIGVATALTAIHGAGVIHRDLKPRNVLLAPGSPKVIDFGIARALEPTSGHTATDQMLGTVAYMAPERFGSAAGATLTPAADVFAWGGVVAYAGTGRTPFQADSPPATAARILTQPPDLSGLPGSLRSLVEHALAKDPADRPTARELLDRLVDGPQRPAATAAALADQPGLREAAAEAQAQTGYDSGRQLTALVAPPDLAHLVGYDEESIITQPVRRPPAPAEPVAAPPRPRRRRWALPVLAALLLLGVLAGVALVAGEWPLVRRDPVAGPATVPAGLGPEALLIEDPLVQERLWEANSDAGEQAGCHFDGGLVARRETRGSWRCRGPSDSEPDDIRAEVVVRLNTRNSCAGIWFRFQENKGYQVRVCETNIYVGTHKSKTVDTRRTFPMQANPIALGVPVHLALDVRGDTVEVFRDGTSVGRVPLDDPELAGGKVLVGVYPERDAEQRGPYEVAFNDIKIWDLSR